MSRLALQEVPSTLNCLLMPVSGQIIILPNVCVAEVKSFKVPAQPQTNSPWLLGLTQWRGLDIPMVSFEKMFLDRPTPFGPMSRLLVVNGIFGLGLDFWAMPILGLPKLLKVKEADVSLADQALQAGQKALIKTEYGTALLPDLSFIEAQVLARG